MRLRLFKSTAVALAVAAIAVPLAGCRDGPRRRLQVGLPPTPRHPHLQRNRNPPRPSTTATSPATPNCTQSTPSDHKPRRSRAPTEPSTGATQPSAREQQPARSSSWRSQDSSSAAAKPGSPSKTHEPAGAQPPSARGARPGLLAQACTRENAVVEIACDHRHRRGGVRARGRRHARADRRACRRPRAWRDRRGLGLPLRQAAPAHGSLAVRPSRLPDPAGVREVARA